MDEDLEQQVALMAAGLSPEEYRRLGPGLREIGLAVAELRQAQQEAQRVETLYERVLEDLERAGERADNALRLWRDAL